MFYFFLKSRLRSGFVHLLFTFWAGPRVLHWPQGGIVYVDTHGRGILAVNYFAYIHSEGPLVFTFIGITTCSVSNY